MAAHAKYALRCPRISQVVDFALAVTAAETRRAKCLIAGKDGKVFDLVTACAAAVGAVVANKGAVTEQKQVGVRVEERSACITAKAVQMPSIASYKKKSAHSEIRSGVDKVVSVGVCWAELAK